MKKSDMIPGHACQLSPGTETAQYVWSRTLKNSPANEDRLRGIPALPRHKLPLVYALGVTEEQVPRAVQAGVVVVV